jgi:hypothetical protein
MGLIPEMGIEEIDFGNFGRDSGRRDMRATLIPDYFTYFPAARNSSVRTKNLQG